MAFSIPFNSLVNRHRRLHQARPPVTRAGRLMVGLQISIVDGVAWIAAAALVLHTLLAWSWRMDVARAADSLPTGWTLLGLYGLPLLGLLPAITVLHLRLFIKTVMIASQSGSRDQSTFNWEALILTPVSARQIIWSQWWSTLRQIAPDALRLAVLHGAAALWLGVYSPRLMLQGGHLTLISFEQLIHPALLLVLLGSVGLSLLLGFGLLAACAIVISLIQASGRWVTAAALYLSLTGVLVIALAQTSVMMISFGVAVPSPGVEWISLARQALAALGTWVAPATWLGGQWLTALFLDPTLSGYLLTTVLLGAAFLALMAFLSLRLAEHLAIRQGALRG